MAKLVNLEQNIKLWALTKAEDYLLIEAYLTVKRFVSKSDHAFVDFERRYFEDGSMLADKSLMHLNTILNRKGFATLHLREGHSDSYTIMKGSPKVEERMLIREALASMNSDQLELVIQAKTDEVRLQAGRDVVYDATKAARRAPLTTVGTAKVASTALTEQLITAVEDGRLKVRPRSTEASPTKATRAAPAITSASTRSRAVISLPSTKDLEPGVTAAPDPQTPKKRLATVKKAMLQAVQDELDDVKKEMSTIRAANGALHATASEIERLKRIVDANRAELCALRQMLRVNGRAFNQPEVVA